MFLMSSCDFSAHLIHSFRSDFVTMLTASSIGAVAKLAMPWRTLSVLYLKTSWDYKIYWILFDRCKPLVAARDLCARNSRFSMLKWASRFTQVLSTEGLFYHCRCPNVQSTDLISRLQALLTIYSLVCGSPPVSA